MTLRPAILSMALLASIFTMGCDSSLQVPKNGDDLVRLKDTDVVNGEVFSDIPDERTLPYVCEEDAESDDVDPCTRGVCKKKRCVYTTRKIDLKKIQIETDGSALDVSLHGSNLLVAMGMDGVAWYNISDLEEPFLEGIATTEGNAISVEAGGPGMSISEGETGMEGLRFPDFSRAYLVAPDQGSLRGLDEIFNLDIGPRFGFTSGFIDGFLIHNWSDVLSGTVVTGFDTTGRVHRVASNNRLALVADALGGALVYGFDLDVGIDEVSKISTEGRMLDVDIAGDTAILGEFGKGFSIVDLSDMYEPNRLTNVYTDTPVTVARLFGSQTAIVGEENGLISVFDVSVNVVDEKKEKQEEEADTEDIGSDAEPAIANAIPIAEPASPVLIDSINLKSEPLRLDIQNDLVAVALGDDGVVLLQTGCIDEEETSTDETE